MTDFGGATLGERIEAYRRLNKMTRDELADATNGVVGRDVIANIENGRRKDVTVNQLLALSMALQVPATALLFDMTKPFADAGLGEVVVGRSVSNGVEKVSTTPLSVEAASRWFGLELWPDFENETTAAGVVANQVFAWQGYRRMTNLFRSSYATYKSAVDLDLVTTKQKYELGEIIYQSWQAYREAKEMGIQGITEPPASEDLAAELLRGSVVSFGDDNAV